MIKIEELFNQCRAAFLCGDSADSERQWEELEAGVRHMALSLMRAKYGSGCGLGNADFEEILQLGWVRLLNNINSPEPGMFLPYFKTILSNLCLDKLKGNKLVFLGPEALELFEDLGSAAAQRNLEMDALLSALKSELPKLLKPRDLEVLEQMYLNRSIQDISIALNISPSMVRTSIKHIRDVANEMRKRLGL